MNKFEWHKALEFVTPYIFKISTPQGSGTGFQMQYSKSKNICGIATAFHVIAYANEWELPIKLFHYESQTNVILKPEDRVVIPFPDKDLAFILFDKKDVPVKTESLELVPPNKMLKQGIEVGWCGFPSVAPNDLCFFEGYISCRLNEIHSYLVDGVAINGVSGGPAFTILPYESHSVPLIGGVVTAYIPNKATGDVLPGVCFIASIEPYQNMLKDLKSLDDAEKKAVEVTKEKNIPQTVAQED